MSSVTVARKVSTNPVSAEIARHQETGHRDHRGSPGSAAYAARNRGSASAAVVRAESIRSASTNQKMLMSCGRTSQCTSARFDQWIDLNPNTITAATAMDGTAMVIAVRAVRRTRSAVSRGREYVLGEQEAADREQDRGAACQPEQADVTAADRQHRHTAQDHGRLDRLGERPSWAVAARQGGQVADGVVVPVGRQRAEEPGQSEGCGDMVERVAAQLGEGPIHVDLAAADEGREEPSVRVG